MKILANIKHNLIQYFAPITWMPHVCCKRYANLVHVYQNEKLQGKEIRSFICDSTQTWN